MLPGSQTNKDHHKIVTFVFVMYVCDLFGE
jgi:hypothetical protein